MVNLCGVNVGSHRWSGAFKQSLRDSRIGPTEVLSRAVVDAISAVDTDPRDRPVQDVIITSVEVTE